MVSFTHIQSYKNLKPTFGSQELTNPHSNLEKNGLEEPEHPNRFSWFEGSSPRQYPYLLPTQTPVENFSAITSNKSQRQVDPEIVLAEKVKAKWEDRAILYLSKSDVVNQLRAKITSRESKAPVSITVLYLEQNKWKTTTATLETPKRKDILETLPSSLPFAFTTSGENSPIIYVGSSKKPPAKLEGYFKSPRKPKRVIPDYLSAPKLLSARELEQLSASWPSELESKAPLTVLKDLAELAETKWDLDLMSEIDVAKTLYYHWGFKKYPNYLHFWTHVFSKIPELKTSLIDQGLLQEVFNPPHASAKAQKA